MELVYLGWSLIGLCNCSTLNFLIYCMRKIWFSFLTVRTARIKQCTLHSACGIVHPCTLHITQHTVHIAQCTVYIAHTCDELSVPSSSHNNLLVVLTTARPLSFFKFEGNRLISNRKCFLFYQRRPNLGPKGCGKVHKKYPGCSCEEFSVNL